MQAIARVYLTSETSTGISMGEGGGSEDSGVGSLPMVLGLMNFFGTRGLALGFDIMEAFARALALGLRARGFWVLF